MLNVFCDCCSTAKWQTLWNCEFLSRIVSALSNTFETYRKLGKAFQWVEHIPLNDIHVSVGAKLRLRFLNIQVAHHQVR